MATEILNVTSEQSYRQSICRAAQFLQDGGLVAIPTETVYGLAVSAESGQAVERLRDIKGRDAGPFTVHVGGREDVDGLLNDITPFQRRLLERAWPGPLTIVFKVPRPRETLVAAGQDQDFINRVYHDDSIGLRCPDCAAARDVIREAGGVVLASSANLRGQAPAVSAQQVMEVLGDRVDIIVDGGPSRYAAASTIVSVQDHDVDILRRGVMDDRTVRKLSRTVVLLICTGNTCRSPMAEGLLRHMLAERLGCTAEALADRGFEVRSAGTFAASGSAPTPEAVTAMQALNIDISAHRSTPLSVELVDEAQVVLAMTRSHLLMAQSLVPQAAARCHMLADHRDIQDPIGGSVEVYGACRDEIQIALRRQLTECIL